MFKPQLKKAAFAGFLALATPLTASAVTLCVNPGGTGGCFASIRGALQHIQYDGSDVIDVAAGTYYERDITVFAPVQIRGAGMHLTIVDGSLGGSGPNVFRFSEGSGHSSLSGMTIQRGRRGVDLGRFNTVTLERVAVAFNGPETGAGIFNNSSTLHLKSSLVYGNHATDVGSVAGCDWGGGSGGGIASLCGGAANFISNSAIVANRASRWGGGLILNDGFHVIENSTISGNAADFPDAGLGGGALFVGGGGPDVTVRFSTIADNTAVGTGGIIGGPVKVYASLLQNNTGRNCTGAISSLGYNVVSDATCALGQPGDAASTDAMLEPLADNGNGTLSHGFGAASPAVDRVPLAACTVAADQDGVARPQHGACDSGAYEHVFTATELLEHLLADVAGVGPGGSIAAKLSAALAAASSGNTAAACNMLGALRNEVTAQAGKKIPLATAQAILAAVAEVQATLGCVG
jgi:hypothetical protein